MNEMDEKGLQILYLTGLGSVLAVRGVDQEDPRLLLVGTAMFLTGMAAALQVLEQEKTAKHHERH